LLPPLAGLLAHLRSGARLENGMPNHGAEVFDRNEQVVPARAEFCICAAIRMSDGEVIYGHRHDNCYRVVRDRLAARLVCQDQEARLAIVRAKQGFVTSTGRFVDRREAMKIQRTSGRVSYYGGRYVGEELFSEDLY
jgi:hypothetical protein